MKLSEKLVYTDYEEARDRAQIKYQIFDEIEELEKENKKLSEEIYQLEQNQESIQELKDKLTERERDIETLHTQIMALQSSEYRVALMKERDDLKSEINILSSINKRDEETIKKLRDKVYDYKKQLQDVKGKNLRCLTCDSFICKANADLGYSYCNAKNGYKGYRAIIKEMD